MHHDPRIRRFTEKDIDRIARVVADTVRECYGHLLPGYRFEADAGWTASWVAVQDGQIVGVVLTAKDWVEDLWIATAHRNFGLGARLLAIAEREIAQRGHRTARLRVVAENIRAIQFYRRHGWSDGRPYPHEINGFDMVDMTKSALPDHA